MMRSNKHKLELDQFRGRNCLDAFEEARHHFEGSDAHRKAHEIMLQDWHSSRYNRSDKFHNEDYFHDVLARVGLQLTDLTINLRWKHFPNRYHFTASNSISFWISATFWAWDFFNGAVYDPEKTRMRLDMDMLGRLITDTQRVHTIGDFRSWLVDDWFNGWIPVIIENQDERIELANTKTPDIPNGMLIKKDFRHLLKPNSSVWS